MLRNADLAGRADLFAAPARSASGVRIYGSSGTPSSRPERPIALKRWKVWVQPVAVVPGASERESAVGS